MTAVQAILFVALWFAVGYAIRKGLKLDRDIDQAIANPSELLFNERFVSGTCLRPIPLPFGAGWALRVVIDREHVWIWPMLGFRPTFLAMVCGLEHKAMRRQVSVVSVDPPNRALFGRRAVVISMKRDDRKPKTLKLYLKHPEEFAAAVLSNLAVSHRESVRGRQFQVRGKEMEFED